MCSYVHRLDLTVRWIEIAMMCGWAPLLRTMVPSLARPAHHLEGQRVLQGERPR